MKFKALTACSAAAMLAAHSAAISIEPETPHARLNEIVKQLDSDTLSQREAAFTSLRTDGAITLDLIEGCLNDPTKDISLEQCTRLERAAFERFKTLPRAAMGVQFGGTEVAVDGVIVQAPIDRFDSMRVLQPGDILQQMDDLVLHRQGQMKAAILSHSPGDVVQLRILRQGEPLVVKLTLGNFEDLPDQGRGGLIPNRAQPGISLRRNELEAWYKPAWQLRRNRMGAMAGGGGRGNGEDRAGQAAKSAAVIDSGLSEEQWALLQDSFDPPVPSRKPSRQAARQGGGQGGFAAGNIVIQPGMQVVLQRPMAPQTELEAVQVEENEVVAPGSGRDTFAHGGGVDFSAGMTSNGGNHQAAALVQRLAQVNFELQQQQMNLANPALGAAQRKMVADKMTALQRQIDQLKAEQKRQRLGAVADP